MIARTGKKVVPPLGQTKIHSPQIRGRRKQVTNDTSPVLFSLLLARFNRKVYQL